MMWFALVGAIVLAICCGMFAASEHLGRLEAEQDADDATRRAERAEAIVDRDLHLLGRELTPELERWFDEALQVADPTPDLRRIK